MSSEAISRLVIRLRAALPDATVEFSGALGARVIFDSPTRKEISVCLQPIDDHFQVIQSTAVVRRSLAGLSAHELARLIAHENQGLRGVTITKDEYDPHALRIRAGFIGQKGRTRDEIENLIVDLLSVVRFARLLEDRIEQSSVADEFCLETYQGLYSTMGRGRSRYVNYARNIFQGSTERVFGQVASMLREDYKYKVQITGPCVAKVTHSRGPGERVLETVLRVPDEIPMIICFAPLKKLDADVAASTAILEELNRTVTSTIGKQCAGGHFEFDASSSMVSFVAWKHLTNDLRYYSLDHMIAAVNRANEYLEAGLDSRADTMARFSSLQKAA
jgi:hypothetical protein